MTRADWFATTLILALAAGFAWFAMTSIARAGQPPKCPASVTIDVLANDYDPDGDPLTITMFTQGAKGSVRLNANQTMTYTPKKAARGTDSFSYVISDGRGGTAGATVTITLCR